MHVRNTNMKSHGCRVWYCYDNNINKRIVTVKNTITKPSSTKYFQASHRHSQTHTDTHTTHTQYNVECITRTNVEIEYCIKLMIQNQRCTASRYSVNNVDQRCSSSTLVNVVRTYCQHCLSKTGRD